MSAIEATALADVISKATDAYWMDHDEKPPLFDYIAAAILRVGLPVVAPLPKTEGRPDLTVPGEGPWGWASVPTEGGRFTGLVYRDGRKGIASLESEEEAIAVCAALNWVAASSPGGGQ